MDKRRKIIKAALHVSVFLLALLVIFSGLRILEATVLGRGQQDDVLAPSKTLTRDGVEYFPRQDITTFLLMGIDRSGPVADSGSYNNPGNADVVMLAIFDETEKTCSILVLNRDTMVSMPVLGIGGRPAGTRYGQLALAHTYGNGLEASSENVVQTVSDLLYGTRIDYYATLNMDAIGILNDAVGGVRVHVTEDFSAVDDTIPMGEVLLNGQQAMSYIRSRTGLGDQLNTSRMERQNEYIRGFMKALQAQVGNSETLALEAYESVSQYLVTNCSSNVLSTVVRRFSEYPLQDVVVPAGESKKGDAYMEFYLNEDVLDTMILKMLYTKKQSN